MFFYQIHIDGIADDHIAVPQRIRRLDRHFFICSGADAHDKNCTQNTALQSAAASATVTPSAAFFFFISLPPARTALRSQTLSIPVIFFTNGDGVNSPSAVSSSSAEKVRYCQPYFSTSCRIPGSCAFRSILAACRTAFGEIPAAASAARTFSSIRPPVYSSYSRCRR